MPDTTCKTCGTRFGETKGCLICEDERQYIGWNGPEIVARWLENEKPSSC